MKIQLYITIYLDKYYIIDHFNIFKGTYYPVLNSSYLQSYLSYLVELGIILKHKRSSVMVNFRVEYHFCVLSHTLQIWPWDVGLGHLEGRKTINSPDDIFFGPVYLLNVL